MVKLERTPAHFIHGLDGGIVIVSANVAAYLMRFAKLEEFRRANRGANPDADMVLDALHGAALTITGSDSGTSRAPVPELKRRWFSTAEAANQLNITDRAVRKAIADHRLLARLDGGRWVIDREDIAKYRRRREP